MERQKKIFTDRSLAAFLIITIFFSAILEAVMIMQGAMGLAVFLMWVPALAAVISGCISQKESSGKISFKALLKNGGFRVVSFKWILLSCINPILYIGIPYVIFWIIFPDSLDMDGTLVIKLLVMSVLGIFIGLLTALGEEIGWRGYFVPAFFERLGLNKALLFTSLFWGAWHLPILLSGLCMPGTPVWYKVPAFLLLIVPVGMIAGLLSVKTKSVWPAAFLHAAHNTFDQTIFGPLTVADNKMYFVSETGVLTIICAWILAVVLYKKLDLEH